MQIHSNYIQYYFELLNKYALYGYLPISCLIIFDANHYAISFNSINEHAEIILLNYYKYYKIQAIFITLEPCISCAFQIIQRNIPYVFFSNYNKQYGGFQILPHKCKVFGGLYINDNLTKFFDR